MASASTTMGPKIQRLPRSSFLPGFMPPKPEKATATLRASETTIAPTRAGDWKNATQSPRPKANDANARPNKAQVLSSEIITQSISRAAVMSAFLRRASPPTHHRHSRQADSHFIGELFAGLLIHRVGDAGLWDEGHRLGPRPSGPLAV